MILHFFSWSWAALACFIQLIFPAPSPLPAVSMLCSTFWAAAAAVQLLSTALSCKLPGNNWAQNHLSSRESLCKSGRQQKDWTLVVFKWQKLCPNHWLELQKEQRGGEKAVGHLRMSSGFLFTASRYTSFHASELSSQPGLTKHSVISSLLAQRIRIWHPFRGKKIMSSLDFPKLQQGEQHSSQVLARWKEGGLQRLLLAVLLI